MDNKNKSITMVTFSLNFAFKYWTEICFKISNTHISAEVKSTACVSVSLCVCGNWDASMQYDFNEPK